MECDSSGYSSCSSSAILGSKKVGCEKPQNISEHAISVAIQQNARHAGCGLYCDATVFELYIRLQVLRLALQSKMEERSDHGENRAPAVVESKEKTDTSIAF